MTRTIVVVAVFIALIVATGVFAFRQGIPVQATQVRRGTIQEFVDERGKTRLEDSHLITMPFAARIAAIEVKEGDRVTKGQIVARVMEKDLEDEVAQDRAVVERLAARIVENDDISVEKSLQEQAELYVESMRSTVAAAEARMTASKSQLDYSETYLGRIRNLVPSGAATRDELDQAELAFIRAQIDYRQDNLTTEALKAIQSATALLPQMVADYIGRKALTHDVLEKEKAEAEARLSQALLRQQRGIMRSPVDGIVLEREVQDEQQLTPGTTLLRIGNLEELEIESDILSEEVVKVRVGDPVKIYGPAVAATEETGVAGTVHRIFPAGFTKLSSLGVEQQRVTTIVRFADGVLGELLKKHSLGVDYHVRVRIITDERDNALLVPRSSLFRSAAGGWQVFAIRNEKAVLVDVKTGLMNDDEAEITEGLSESDQVILAPESTLRSGTRVVVE